jgi:hypothetical protein
MNNLKQHLLASLCLAPLAACGGGDGGISSRPTPTTPVATTNETLSNLVASQTFDTASTTLTATVRTG